MKRQSIQGKIYYIFLEIDDLIFQLYQVNDFYTKNVLVKELWSKVSYLQYLNQLILSEGNKQTPQVPIPVPVIPPVAERQFTLEELSSFTGKNGKPAYIAVDGVVYDVTNNAAWAAASHFGLSAGRDLSQEFQSCHSGQRGILTKLKVVGRLVS